MKTYCGVACCVCLNNYILPSQILRDVKMELDSDQIRNDNTFLLRKNIDITNKMKLCTVGALIFANVNYGADWLKLSKADNRHSINIKTF